MIGLTASAEAWKEVGRCIEQARRRLQPKTSGREIARRAGISEGWYRVLARGERQVRGVSVPVASSPDTLAAVAQAVEMTDDERRDLLALVGYEDTAPPAPPPAPDINPGAARRFDALDARLDRIEAAVLQLVEREGRRRRPSRASGD